MQDLHIIYLGFIKILWNFAPVTVLIITAWILGLYKEYKRYKIKYKNS